MLALLGSLLFVALVNAQQPEPCATPAEWHGRQMTVDPAEKISVFARLSYDQEGERISIVEEVDVKKEKEFYEYIFLYREKTVYKIELSTNKTGKCVKEELNEPFRRFEIPANATALGAVTIGSNALSGAGVNVVVFAGETEEGDRYYVTVTETGCVPVSEGIMTQKYGFMHTRYFDVELGVDPERFIPPKDCES